MIRRNYNRLLWLWIVSSAILMTTDYPYSDDKCEFADVLADRFVQPGNRGGELRISLSPPDYEEAKSVHDHLVFSTIMARLLTSELKGQTYGQCDARIDTSRFPDLHVYLIVDRPSRDGSEVRLRCIRTLQGILLHWEPQERSIRKSAEEEARFRLNVIANPGASFSNASTILRAALAHIYQAGSVLHAMHSVGPEHFKSFDASLFQTWLYGQRSSGRIRLNAISLCPPGLDPQDARANLTPYKLPYSDIIPPGTVRLPTKDSGLTRYLRRVVIVGHAAILNAPDLPALTSVRVKYCNRDHLFAAYGDAESSPAKRVRVRCLTSVGYERDSWTVFFCDPQDCTSEHQAETVVTAIAKDPDVWALAGSNAESGQPRGPYLIELETKGE
jgi:hypothetical protein